MVAAYVPDIGDIVWLSLNPQIGREQSGRRPFLVLSPRGYNEKTSLAIGVPITSKAKGYPFEVPLKKTSTIGGVALADHVKSLDWRARNAAFIENAPPSTLRSVRHFLSKLLFLA